MKRRYAITISLLLALKLNAQNVGIGIPNPAEKLEVNGAIRIGNTNLALPGSIRWNNSVSDFEGYNGSDWKSFTTAKSNWSHELSLEATSTDLLLNEYENVGSTSFGKTLGQSISLSGNYLAAGAPNDYNGSLVAGTTRIFKLNNNKWQPYFEIKAATPGALDQYGASVAMHGNYVICGAPNATINGVTSQGKAYIYYFDDSFLTPSSTQQAELSITPVVNSGIRFGYSVAINDQFAAIGAPTYEGYGKVYVYKRTNNTWSLMTSPVFPDPHPGDFYGNAVCLWNNYLVVGAYRGDVNNIYNRGKVYLYRLNPSATGWEYITSLWGPGNESENMFGTSLYLRNDTLLVGASGDFITRRIGYVHMYVRNGNSWPLVASLTAPDVTVNDGFGASVHYSNGRVIIGAPEASAVNLAQGKVYIFSHNSSQWKCDATLVSLGGKSWDAFGKSVALSAQTAFVSAPHHDVYGGSGDTRYDNGKIYFYNK